MLHDLRALKYIPIHENVFTHLSKRFCVPATDEDIRLKSSINALTKGRAKLPVGTNLPAGETKVYSTTAFIPARKRIT